MSDAKLNANEYSVDTETTFGTVFKGSFLVDYYL